MAAYENVRNITVNVAVVAGVAAAQMYRFCEIDAAASEPYAVKTQVAAALGALPDGIMAMNPDVNIKDGFVSAPMALADGGQCLVELGEICAKGDWLRVGGNGGEVDGAAYLANAAGDIRVAKALKAGVVGEIIPIVFYGFRGVTP